VFLKKEHNLNSIKPVVSRKLVGKIVGFIDFKKEVSQN
jgi:hypothetical protein